ncbi:MAG TPA: phage holin family protein [Armatimonadota bacterium]|nr:phage holin family protein [Armatimonadota bacterium]HOS44192.1 phage holin family protein [Armatimonadota bacterium]
MRRTFINWVISALALLLAAAALRGGVAITPWWHVIWLAPALGLINAIVGGLIGFFGFPLNLLTLGCFGFVASFLLYAAAIYLLQQYTRGILTVESFGWALALAAVMALFSAVLNMFLGGDDRRR